MKTRYRFMPIRQASLMLSLDDKGANSRHSCPLMVGVLFGKITLGTMWQHLKVHIHTEALDLTLPPLFMPREITACGQWDTGRGVFMSLLFMLVKNLKQSNCLQRKKIMCVIVMQLNSCNNENVCVCVRTCVLSCVQLLATQWTVAHQAPLSMEFSRQEYWSGLPFPSPGDIPDLGIETSSPVSCISGQIFSYSVTKES